MITIDSDPVLNPVNIGAQILSKLASSDVTEVRIEDLYSSVVDKFEASYDVFIVALDWLYVIGAIEVNENGLIEYAAK